MGKLADLNIPTREGNLRNPERLNQSLKDIGQKAEPWKKLATEGFGQVLLGDEGTIPWYMSFAPGADLTDKLMEGRQPGLLDVPGPGTLAKMAMLPIMKLGAKEILEGTARMGKNARNLDKAKNPVIERWHRTRSMNDESIRSKGLLVGKDNPNYGINTGDQNSLPIPAAWLGTSPTEVPVLQYYAMNRPDEVSMFRVRIPKDVYYDTPRMKWPSGYRGDASDAVIVPKGKSSLTGETGRRTGGQSKIDLFGSSIKPEWVEKVPNEEVTRLKQHADELKGYGKQHLSDNLSPSEIGNQIVREEMDSWMPAIDRWSLGSFSHIKPLQDDVWTPQEQIAESARLYNDTPFYKMGTQSLVDDIPEKFRMHNAQYPKERMPSELSQIAKGHISRGWWNKGRSRSLWDIRNRRFDWKLYDKLVSKGYTPWAATRQASPLVILSDTPEAGLVLRELDMNNVNRGHISRGTAEDETFIPKLRDIASRPEAFPSSSLNILLNMYPSRASNILEAIYSSKGSLGKLRDVARDTKFTPNLGSISRTRFSPSTNLNDWRKQLIDYFVKKQNMSLEMARKRSLDELRNHIRFMKDPPYEKPLPKTLSEIMQNPSFH